MKNRFKINQKHLLRLIVVCPLVLVILNWIVLKDYTFFEKYIIPNLPQNFEARMFVILLIYTWPSVISALFLNVKIIKKLLIIILIITILGVLSHVVSIIIGMVIRGGVYP